MQQKPNIEKIDSKEELSWLKRTIYTAMREVCVNLRADTDKLNNVVQRYRNSL